MRNGLLTGCNLSRATLVAALLAAGVVLAGGCGGGEEESANAPAEGEEVAEEAPEEQTSAPETTGEVSGGNDIGEVFTVGVARWSVTEVEELDELISDKGEFEEGNFVVTDVAFQNNSNQDAQLATPFLTLIDGEGNEFEPEIDINFTFLYPEENMFVGQVEPGATDEGKVIFAVEPDSSGFKLEVNEGRFAPGETAYIDLGI